MKTEKKITIPESVYDTIREILNNFERDFDGEAMYIELVKVQNVIHSCREEQLTEQ